MLVLSHRVWSVLFCLFSVPGEGVMGSQIMIPCCRVHVERIHKGVASLTCLHSSSWSMAIRTAIKSIKLCHVLEKAPGWRVKCSIQHKAPYCQILHLQSFNSKNKVKLT